MESIDSICSLSSHLTSAQHTLLAFFIESPYKKIRKKILRKTLHYAYKERGSEIDLRRERKSDASLLSHSSERNIIVRTIKVSFTNFLLAIIRHVLSLTATTDLGNLFLP